MMPDAFKDLLGKLRTYKKKYYINLLLKGSLFFIGLTSTAYLLFTTIEHYGRLETYYRLVIFFGFLSIAGFGLYKWIAIPVYKLFNLDEELSDEEAAKQIGKYFPEISDKLLNTLQLKKINAADNIFIQASINQKTKEVNVFNFKEAINFNKNKKYARYVAFPLACILILLIFIPQFLTESTARIINYSKVYEHPAPFKFVVLNEDLTAYKNDPFDVTLKIDGSTLPDQVYIVNNGRRSKMKKEGADNYNFSFKNIQRNETISFEAAGYSSREYTINVISRPYLKNFMAFLKFPPYLNKKAETLKNAGNMTVPEGTEIVWEFNTVEAENIYISQDNKQVEKLSSSKDLFTYKKKALKSENFLIELENKNSKSKEAVNCHIQVIPDQHPSINVEQFKDTVLFRYISLGGNVSDDYGLTKLLLHYKIKKDNKADESKAIRIPIDTRSPASNFFFDWNLDSLNIKPGDKLEYFLEVWDNDGVNGSKKTRSINFEYKIPDKSEIKKEIEDSSQKTEKELEQILSKTKNISKDINKMEEKLKTKKTLTWQDKKTIEEIRKKHEELKEELEKLNKLNEQLQQKQDKFSELNPELAQKMEELKKLMEELLDEDTKKLYEELEKLLQQNAQKEQIQKTLEDLKKKDLQMEKELERALEMFKELKFEQKLDQIIKDLQDLAEKQKELAEKTENKEGKNEDLIKEQEKLNKEFEELKKDINDLEDINKSLENQKDLKDTQDDEQDISNDQQKGSEQLKNNQNKKAGSSQKSAGEKMEKLSKEMAAMQADMQAEQAQEDMDDLRYILENLVRLSFEQEELMKSFRKVNQSDPRFLQLSQQQLKLIDDSKIIEDSLIALSKRVFQIQSFVTREVDKMKGYMDESMDAIKNRRPDIAAGKQQFAMTSINNLALMLDDVLKQMQEQMAQAMQQQKGGGQQCKKPGKNQMPGNMGDLQKQLNQRIENLKKGGMQGQQLSEELAKLAAQQEMIRNALKEMQKAGGKEAGKELGELMKKMEETETDLVNKRITQETMLRQKDIMTRLLEAEKAMRERELDEKRESNTGKELQRELPPSFEKYLKAKEKQIELLKTVSPTLSPYYRNEVNEYFKKLEK